ncbi:hypothetical protein KC842_01805 [Candidatus Nomurabacteria bacterium]|nr:hypothetical protein [Candidatus Nomurabacteria bacterium]
MKKIIKKFVFVPMVIMALFGQAGVASATWTYLNTDPADFDTVTVRNSTVGGGCTDCADWSSVTSAEDGDTIAIAFYYHVTGPVAADDLRFLLDTPSGVSETSSSVTVKGTVVADNASAISQTVTVNISGGGKLVYKPGSAKWYPDQLDTYTTLPFSEYDLFSASGGSVGTIGTGWAHQGSLVVQYTVSGSTTAPEVVTESATSVDSSDTTLNGSLTSLGGASSASVYFKWGTSTGSLTNTTSTSTKYSTGSFSKEITGLSEGTTYYFQAVASTGSGTDYGTIKSFYISYDGSGSGDDNQDFDVDTLSANSIEDDRADLRGKVYAGDYDVDSCWFEWGYDDSISDLDYTKYADCSVNDGDTETVEETLTGLDSDEVYYYRFCAEDDDGDKECGSIEDFRTDDNNGSSYSSGDDAPQVVTTIAKSITANSAQLNGLMVDAGGETSYGFFEWGPSTTLAFTTFDQTLGDDDDVSFWNTVTGLAPNTTYYFRACAKNGEGTDCGDILTFRTLGLPVVTVSSPVVTNPVVINTGVVAGVSTGNGNGSNLLMLTIEAGESDVCYRDEVDYVIEWENISGRDLDDAVLQIALQKGVKFVDTSRGDYINDDHMIIYEIGNLDRGEDGRMTITLSMTDRLETQEPLVTTALMAFTDSETRAQEDVIAYELQDVSRCGSALGAFALFGNSFLPSTLIGWLIIALLILAIIIIVRTFYKKDEDKLAPVVVSNDRNNSGPTNLPGARM